MRFFTTLTAAIVAAAVAVPAYATPVGNPLHSHVAPYGGVRPKPADIHHARDELDARGFFSDKITAWLDKNIHLHRREELEARTIHPSYWSPPINPGIRPGGGLFHTLPYKPGRPVVARSDASPAHKIAASQGWQGGYWSPPFVNPNIIRPGGGIDHSLWNKPARPAVAREEFRTAVMPQGWKPSNQNRPFWDRISSVDDSYRSPPFVNPATLPKRAATNEFHTEVIPQKDRPVYQSPPFVPPSAIPRPPYGAGVRPRPLGPGVRPLTN